MIFAACGTLKIDAPRCLRGNVGAWDNRPRDRRRAVVNLFFAVFRNNLPRITRAPQLGIRRISS